MKKLQLLSLAALMLAGCTTVQRTSAYNGVKVEGGRTPVGTVEIENVGWFLLGFIPLASGNPAMPDQCSCRWFTNTVTLENNVRVLRNEMEKAGVDAVANLTSHWTDESAFVILLKRRACHTSAVLLGPPGQSLETAK